MKRHITKPILTQANWYKQEFLWHLINIITKWLWRKRHYSRTRCTTISFFYLHQLTLNQFHAMSWCWHVYMYPEVLIRILVQATGVTETRECKPPLAHSSPSVSSSGLTVSLITTEIQAPFILWLCHLHDMASNSAEDIYSWSHLHVNPAVSGKKSKLGK